MRAKGLPCLAAALLAGQPALAQTSVPAADAVQPYAIVSCSVQPDLKAGGCSALGEAPAGRGLAKAAVKVLEGAPGVSVGGGAARGQFLVAVCFDLSGKTPVMTAVGSGCPVAPALYSDDDLIERPSAFRLRQRYPARALQSRMAGEATIKCSVDQKGRMAGCGVAEEQPRGAGFGVAAVELAPAYAVRPKVIDGYARPGTITLVVKFAP